MSVFITEDFLLDSPASLELYHDHAAHLPIIDYHCHLSPGDIARNRKFKDITEAWLEGDHYKWRAMRANGVEEEFITGRADNKSKFKKWAETVPYTVRNPLYHWTHLELKRYFQVDTVLSSDSSEDIYDHCSGQLQLEDFSVRGLMKKMGVDAICTTDDPVDDLNAHEQIRKDGFEIAVLPAFRPDKAILIHRETFPGYLKQLGEATGRSIGSFAALINTLFDRINYFHDHGCRLSDHGLDRIVPLEGHQIDPDAMLHRRLAGQTVSIQESLLFQHLVLRELGKAYHDKGWVQQFHLGALRNVNSRMVQAVGPDTGYDSIGDFTQTEGLASLFDYLDKSDRLPKTILYNLNPNDNEAFIAMAGCFNDGIIPGKMQFGSAWWYLDTLYGMEKQIDDLSNIGLLSRFVGMLTDSRSFLSFPRHEYFRRLLCRILGRDVVNGLLPHDLGWLGKIVQDICYYNAKHYFRFPSPP